MARRQERRELFVSFLTGWMQKRRLDEALSREELANLDSINRLLAQRHSLMDNLGHYFASSPRADVATGILVFITFLSDNNCGCCTLSIPRLARFFKRSERAISEAIARLEQAQVIFVERTHHQSSRYWPVINRGFGGQQTPLIWFVDVRAPARMNGRPPSQKPPEADCRGFTETPRSGEQNPPNPASGNTTNSTDKNATDVGFELVKGKIVLLEEDHREWLGKFGSSERLDAALGQAVGYIKPGDTIIQVRSQLNQQHGRILDAARIAQQQRSSGHRFYRRKGAVTKGLSISASTIRDTQDATNEVKRFKAGDPEFAGEVARLHREGETEEANKYTARGWVNLKPADAERALSWDPKPHSVSSIPDAGLGT